MKKLFIVFECAERKTSNGVIEYKKIKKFSDINELQNIIEREHDLHNVIIKNWRRFE